MGEARRLVEAPVNEKLSPRQRLECCLRISELIAKMATHVISHVIVDHQDLLVQERLSVANAFVQRVTSTHLCNHKLTKEGIVYHYKGETFRLHEEFKTMTLTRSVYEHLAMFYFLFFHPKTQEEQAIVWYYWKINSKKNLLGYEADGEELTKDDQDKARGQIEQLRAAIFGTETGRRCRHKLDEWTKTGAPGQNGSIEFFENQGKTDVRRLTYGQAWKYLFDHDDMTLLYRHLSMHCHPVYDGLLQYQRQALSDEGYDGIPLYLSSCFLAYLCRLFLGLVPGGDKMFDDDFTPLERYVFSRLAQAPSS